MMFHITDATELLGAPLFASMGARMSRTASVLVILISVAVPASAIPINYGDFVGTSVDYLQVTEDANSLGDNPPLFGAPIVSGNSLDFNPVGFSAAAAGAGGSDTTDGQLTFMIMSHAGFGIPTVGFSEKGDTLLAGFDLNGADAPNTLTQVTAEVFIDILEVDGVALLNPINVQDDLVFTPHGGLYELHDEGGGGPLYQTDWSGSLSVSLNNALNNAGIPFVLGATKVSVSLDNTLVAVTQEGTEAFIAKKDFDVLSITVVPEPTSSVLVVLGMVGAILYRRAK